MTLLHKGIGVLGIQWRSFWFFLDFGVHVFGSCLDCMNLLMTDDEHYMMKPAPNVAQYSTYLHT